MKFITLPGATTLARDVRGNWLAKAFIVVTTNGMLQLPIRRVRLLRTCFVSVRIY